MADDLYKQEGYDLMAAAFEVYNQLGHGFLEDVYQEALEKELRARGIPFTSKPAMAIRYKGELLQKCYYPDIMAFDGIITELKAVQQLAREHDAQLLNYLKGTGKRVGYLLNFGASKGLEWKRLVL